MEPPADIIHELFCAPGETHIFKVKNLHGEVVDEFYLVVKDEPYSDNKYGIAVFNRPGTGDRARGSGSRSFGLYYSTKESDD